MKPLFFLAAVFCAFAADPPAVEEKAIRQVLSGQVEAWNRGDIPRFMDGYEKSGATTFVSAAVTRGHQPVLDGYVKKYPTRDAMGKLAFSEIEVHMLGAGHAWVLGRFDLERNAAGGGNKGGRFTLVFSRTSQGWKIVLDHTS